MKALQRWRNGDSDGASDARRSRSAAAASATSSSPIRTDGHPRIKSAAAQLYYDNPQDTLYPSNAASIAAAAGGDTPQLAAVPPARRSKFDQADSSITRTLRQRSIKRGKVKSLAEVRPNRTSTNDTVASRIAPDAANGKQFDSFSNGLPAVEAANGQSIIKVTNGTERSGLPSWRKPLRASPQKNAELPADIASMPKLSASGKSASRDDNVPVFVVSQASPTSAAPQNGATSAQARSAPPSTSSFRNSVVTGGGSSRAVNGSAESASHSASTPDAHHNVNHSVSSNGSEMLNSTKHRNASGEFANLSTSRSSNALQTPLHYDVGAVSPVSSAPSSPDPDAVLQSSSSNGASGWDNSYEKDSRILRSPSTFSLRSARSRLSGVLGTWNRSSSGLIAARNAHDGQATSKNSGSTMAPTVGPSRSQTLAHELNELAVAFEEGLLGEDDYRLLRKGAFDKMVNQGGMDVPRESTLRAPSSGTLATPSPQMDDNSSYVDGSIRSKPSENAGNTSISRTRSLRSRITNGTGELPGDRSIYSTAGSLGGRSRSRQEKQQVLQEQYLQARRAKTLRGAVSMNTLDAFNDPASSRGVNALEAAATQHDRHAMASSGASTFTGISAGGLSISGSSALLARDYADKSSEQIQAEIAVVEAERQRIVDNFKTLEVHAIGRYKLSFEQIRRAIVNAGGEAASQAARTVGVPTSAPPTKAKADTMRVSRLFGRMRHDSTPKERRNQPPPSASLGHLSSAPATMTMTSGTGAQSAWQSNNDEEDAEVRKLQRELQEIHRRRVEVTTKYGDRLAFLRSTLRSAKIREGLR